MTQAALFDPKEVRRDAGMEAAIQHAEAETPHWRAESGHLLEVFVEQRRSQGQTFLTEDFVAFALACGLAEPPDRRAFGSLIRCAAKRGLIEKAGYETDRFCSPKALWK